VDPLPPPPPPPPPPPAARASLLSCASSPKHADVDVTTTFPKLSPEKNKPGVMKEEIKEVISFV
jgi:hypothetical protein